MPGGIVGQQHLVIFGGGVTQGGRVVIIGM